MKFQSNYQTILGNILATTLFAAMAIPAGVMAQGATPGNPPMPFHHYKLVDMGTLSGPNSSLSGPFAQILNNQGTLAALANTATPNPNANCAIPFNANGGGGDCFVEHPVLWRNGTLTDLELLPGAANGQTDWIAGNGLVAGWSENGLLDVTGLPVGRAVLWTKDRMVIDLGAVPGGTESLATAVNSLGEVVGFSDNDIPDAFSMVGVPTQTRAFLWQNGVMKDLGTLGGSDALAFLVNERGQIVGQSYTNSIASINCVAAPLTTHSFLWEGGKMLDLGTFGGTCTYPNWLSQRGQVVGVSNLAGDATHHGFLWSDGALTDVGTLGGNNSEANWVSETGFVVGRADVSGSQSHHAFRWKNGVMTDLGILQGWPCSTAIAVSSTGQVVGETGICGIGGGPAFLSENGGQMVDVNTLVVPGSDIEFISGWDINDRGEIPGIGLLPSGDVHAVLLIPCDANHPNVAGCDYSLAEASGASASASAPPNPAKFSNTNMMMRLRVRMAGRYGLRGTQ
jgi:probable HAF family extracellular repeat protein